MKLAAATGRGAKTRRRAAIHFGSAFPPHRRAARRAGGHCALPPGLSGGPGAGRAAGRGVSAAGTHRHGQDPHGGSAGRGAARQREKPAEDRLRRIPDGARGRQADRRAAGLPGAPRDAAHADAGQAHFGHQREIQPVAGAVRRDREGRSVADAPAVGHPGQSRAAARRQHHGELRAQHDLPDQQSGRAPDAETRPARFRRSGGRGRAGRPLRRQAGKRWTHGRPPPVFHRSS